MIHGSNRDFEAEVGFYFNPGEPAVTHLLPENCSPEDPDNYELVSLTLLFAGKNYRPFKADASAMLEQEKIQEDIINQLIEKREKITINMADTL